MKYLIVPIVLAVILIGGCKEEKKEKPERIIDPISLEVLQLGSQNGSIEITYEGPVERSGESVKASDSFIGARVLSFFGLSPNEVVAKKTLKGTSAGVDIDAKGYGILEQGWERLKSFGVVVGIGLIAFIAIGWKMGFLATILRWIASLIPVVGSLVQKSFDKKQIDAANKVATQTIVGIENIKKVISDSQIVEIIKAELAKTQDEDTKAKVDEVKASIK